jgi:rubrerythrin
MSDFERCKRCGAPLDYIARYRALESNTRDYWTCRVCGKLTHRMFDRCAYCEASQSDAGAKP